MRHEWTANDPDDPVELAVEHGKYGLDFWFRYPEEGAPWRSSDGDPVSFAAEILRLAARVRELEDGLREAYWLAHDAWNKNRFGRHNADEAKELRREMAGVLGRVGMESPGHPGQGVTE